MTDPLWVYNLYFYENCLYQSVITLCYITKEDFTESSPDLDFCRDIYVIVFRQAVWDLSLRWLVLSHFDVSVQK